MNVLHRGGGSWKKTEALAWTANALTRAKTNVLTHARIWRGIRMVFLTSPCGERIRFVMSYPVWRGPEPTRVLNSQKNAPTKPSADGWWGRGAPSGAKELHSPGTLSQKFRLSIGKLFWRERREKRERRERQSFLAFLACLAFLASSQILL